MSARLAGRTALVTGAGRGIGQAIAECLAAEGASLTLVARSAAELASAAQRARAAGAPAVDVERCDLTDRAALADLCRRVAANADVLVNNAGVAPSAPIERSDDGLWRDTLELDAYAPFALCRAALPAMAARGWGRIVNLASTAALEGYAYTAVYVAAKHALLGLTRALSVETLRRWPAADLSINAVCPAFVDTRIVEQSAGRIAAATGASPAEARAQLAALNPGGRLLTPAEVAIAVRDLVCESPARTRGAALRLPG